MKGLLGWTIVVGSILLGFVVAIAFLAGLSGLIWDGAVFEPHPSRTAPWSIFFTAAIPVVAPVVAYLALCFIALPLLAKCNVPIDKSKGFYAGLAALVKRIAASYVSLMDGILEQTSEGSWR